MKNVYRSDIDKTHARLGPFQTSLFSCAEPNANQFEQRILLIYIKLGSAHEKSDVWNGPYLETQQGVKYQQGVKNVFNERFSPKDASSKSSGAFKLSFKDVFDIQ